MTKKNFFYDHLVLLLLSINVFVAVMTFIEIIIRISATHRSSYFIQYRPILGTGAYKTGSQIDLISFSVFAIIITGINFLLSQKVYKIHRQLSVLVLSIGILLLALNLIISNSLIQLR